MKNKDLITNDRYIALGESVASMMHELKNLIGGIKNTGQNIKRRLDPELKANQEVAAKHNIDLKNLEQYIEEREIDKFLEDIEKTVQKQIVIINNTLDYGCSDREVFQDKDLNIIIKNTVEFLESVLEPKRLGGNGGVNLVLDLEDNKQLIKCKEHSVSQVLINLIKNSLDFLENITEPKIIIKTEINNKQIILSVSDNGPGIKKENCSKVFEKGFSTKEHKKGQGLGLYIIKDIIQEHGWDIKVESHEGLGTKFIIVIVL